MTFKEKMQRIDQRAIDTKDRWLLLASNLEVLGLNFLDFSYDGNVGKVFLTWNHGKLTLEIDHANWRAHVNLLSIRSSYVVSPDADPSSVLEQFISRPYLFAAERAMDNIVDGFYHDSIDFESFWTEA